MCVYVCVVCRSDVSVYVCAYLNHHMHSSLAGNASKSGYIGSSTNDTNPALV